MIDLINQKNIKMGEEKYMPNMSGMNVEEQAGVATAVKKMAERRYKKFKNEMEEKKNGAFTMKKISRKSKI